MCRHAITEGDEVIALCKCIFCPASDNFLNLLQQFTENLPLKAETFIA